LDFGFWISGVFGFGFDLDMRSTPGIQIPKSPAIQNPKSKTPNPYG
jgi:hypothetical protein